MSGLFLKDNMKYLGLILIIILSVSCNKETAEKPARLLSENEMTDILYDLSLMQGMRQYNPKLLHDKNITVSSYIYEKYDIDSVLFVENHKYYASDMEQYEKIHKRVSERLRRNSAVFDSITKKPTAPAAKKPDLGKSRDSILKLKRAWLDSLNNPSYQ